MHAAGFRKKQKQKKQKNEQARRPFRFVRTRLQANKSAGPTAIFCTRGKEIANALVLNTFCSEDICMFCSRSCNFVREWGSDSLSLFLKMLFFSVFMLIKTAV